MSQDRPTPVPTRVRKTNAAATQIRIVPLAA